jgi:hypothetical protein
MPRIVSTADRWSGCDRVGPTTSIVRDLVALGTDRIVAARPIRLIREGEAVLGTVLRFFRPSELVAPANDVGDFTPVEAPPVAPRRESVVSARTPGIGDFIAAMVDLLHRDLFGGVP